MALILLNIMPRNISMPWLVLHSPDQPQILLFPTSRRQFWSIGLPATIYESGRESAARFGNGESPTPYNPSSVISLEVLQCNPHLLRPLESASTLPFCKRLELAISPF